MSKKICRVPTPMEMVNHMLDQIGYIHDLYGQRVLENSCGEGNFLCEIVRRYIDDARAHGYSDTLIREGLERDIHGIEKEEQDAAVCVRRLDETVEEMGIEAVRWHIEVGDALSLEVQPIYQYVVGNPPYITYYNLEKKDRELIRKQYLTCAVGKADYYYAFTEAAIRSLAPDGKLAYLIPNNFLKNRYSEGLRKYMLPYLTRLEDYTTRKIFDYLTSTAVIFCQNGYVGNTFQYCDVEKNEFRDIEKEKLEGKWTFDAYCAPQEHALRMKDCFQVSAPIATLLNEAFILTGGELEAGGYRTTDNIFVEREVLRPAASPKSRQRGIEAYIIFPYWYENGSICRYGEDEFRQRFPGAYKHLRTYEDRMNKRDKDRTCRWHEYGRSQALSHIDQPKIMLSTLITNHVRYYRLGRDEVPYSGMYLVPREGYTLDQAEEILRSDDFYQYICSVGINASGNSYRISPKDVGEYILKEEV